MPNNNNSTENTDWKQAVELCKNFIHLDTDLAIEKINSLSLSDSIRAKAINLLSRYANDNTILDQQEYLKINNESNNAKTIIGKIIDSYKIISLIAKGGMSSVYKAEHIKAGEQKAVALKILSPFVYSNKSIELFNREQLILSKLEHPNIISFHHGGQTEDGTRYLIMEYIEAAQTISQYSSNENLSNKQIILYIQKLAKVFAYAHINQIIHRDIKPSNILIDQHGHLNVIDFGIGQIISDNDNTSTKVFTLDTAAPEQILGLDVNTQSDIFSLGAVLLQLLVKKKPLPKTSIADYDPQDDVKHIAKLLAQSNLDKDLQNIIKTAIHIDRDKRYTSMDLFSQDLGSWLESKPISASSDSFYYRCKKLYKRNRAVSAISLITFLVATASVIGFDYINTINNKVQLQKKNSMAIIEALFNQADPWLNNNNNSELIKYLDKITQQQVKLLQSDPELKYFFYNKMATVYNNKGLYLQALKNRQKAFLALKQYTSNTDDLYLDNQISIYHLMETTGQLKKTKEKAYEMLLTLKKLPQADPKHRLELFYLLSKVHGYSNEYQEALEIGKKAQIWMNNNSNIDPYRQAQMYNSMAVNNSRLSNFKRAEILYLKAIGYYEKIENMDIKLSATLTNLAGIKGMSRDFKTSEKYFKRAIKLAKHVDENHPALSKAYISYSSMLKLSGRTSESLKNLNIAIAILKINGENQWILSLAYSKSANIHLIQHDVSSAISNIENSYNIRIKSSDKIHRQIIELYVVTLRVLLLENDHNIAKAFVEIVDQHTNPNIFSSKFYKDYLFLRSLALKQSYSSDDPHSLIAYYLYSNKLETKEQKQNWLSKNIIKNKNNQLITAWLQTQLWLLDSTLIDLKNICYDDIQWNNSEKFILKFMILKACINQQQIDPSHVNATLIEYYKKVKSTPSQGLKLQKLFNELLAL